MSAGLWQSAPAPGRARRRRWRRAPPTAAAALLHGLLLLTCVASRPAVAAIDAAWSPVQREAGIVVQPLRAGRDHTCGVTDSGIAYCWGRNQAGQLGNGNVADAPAPVRVQEPAGMPPGRWLAMQAGAAHTCGVRDEGSAWCWGSADDGALGDGSALLANANASAASLLDPANRQSGTDRVYLRKQLTPVRVAGNDSWALIAVGLWHTCGIKNSSNDAFCWGYNEEGQCGYPPPANRTFPEWGRARAPVKVIDPATGPVRWAQLSAAERHTCGTTVDGKAFCWGANTAGQLGIPVASGNIPVPEPVSPVFDAQGRPQAWDIVRAGDTHSCGLTAEASAWCWGTSYEGALGAGAATNSSVPLRVTAGDPAAPWLHIACGRAGTCGIQNGGVPVCFGDLPADVGALAPVARVTVSLAGSQRPHVCFLGRNGSAFCAGSRRYGQLGDGALVPEYTTAPVPVAGGFTWGPRAVVGGPLDVPGANASAWAAERGGGGGGGGSTAAIAGGVAAGVAAVLVAAGVATAAARRHRRRRRRDEEAGAVALGEAAPGRLPSGAAQVKAGGIAAAAGSGALALAGGGSSAPLESSESGGLASAGSAAAAAGPPAFATISVDEVELGRAIGSGAYGEVRLGRWKHLSVAVKLLSPRRGGGGEFDAALSSGLLLSELRREAEILSQLRHPNVLLLLGVILRPPAVVTEFCARGSLADVLARARREGGAAAAALSWRRRLAMLLDAARGMVYLHSRSPPVLHRDLKSPNLLVDAELRVKVGDLGLSRVLPAGAPHAPAASAGGAANPRWVAPENLAGAPFTAASDVYAFGVVMWEALAWRLPWEGDGEWAVVGAVQAGRRPELPPAAELPGPPPPRGGGALAEYAALMRRCWAQDAGARPDFDAVASQLKAMLAGAARAPASHPVSPPAVVEGPS